MGLVSFGCWILKVAAAALGGSPAPEGLSATDIVLGFMFVGAFLHPRVCPTCGSSQLVPDTSPRAKRIAGSVVNNPAVLPSPSEEPQQQLAQST